MLNFMCKPDRGLVAKTFRDNHQRGVLDDINTEIHRLSKADDPPWCGWATSYQKWSKCVVRDGHEAGAEIGANNLCYSDHQGMLQGIPASFSS